MITKVYVVIITKTLSQIEYEVSSTEHAEAEIREMFADNEYKLFRFVDSDNNINYIKKEEIQSAKIRFEHIYSQADR